MPEVVVAEAVEVAGGLASDGVMIRYPSARVGRCGRRAVQYRLFASIAAAGLLVKRQRQLAYFAGFDVYISPGHVIVAQAMYNVWFSEGAVVWSLSFPATRGRRSVVEGAGSTARMISHHMTTSDTSAGLESSARAGRAQARAGAAFRRGQSLVEYILIILFVALAVFLALSLLAPTLNSIFRSLPPAL